MGQRINHVLEDGSTDISYIHFEEGGSTDQSCIHLEEGGSADLPHIHLGKGGSADHHTRSIYLHLQEEKSTDISHIHLDGDRPTDLSCTYSPLTFPLTRTRAWMVDTSGVKLSYMTVAYAWKKEGKSKRKTKYDSKKSPSTNTLTTVLHMSTAALEGHT